MVRPPALVPGATVGVLAPASPVRVEFVERGLAELERLGFRARASKHLHARGRYTAGSPADRLADWHELWEERDVAAIFCARGGYGSMELLAGLSPERIRRDPKIVLGSSDVTALLGFLGARADLVSFHGPMVAQQIARGAYDAAQLVRLLGSPEPAGRLPSHGAELLHEGSAEGRLVGGCLSMLVALVGTPFLPSFDGGILFVEDTQVKPYQIDRMLLQLELAGLLDGVRGLVFGQMPGCQQHEAQGYTLKDMLRDWTARLRLPVLFGFPSGHTETDGLTLPLGVRARLDAEGLAILEGAVA